MSTIIRVARPEDAEAILAIYAPIVRETAISFEVEPPTRVEMQQRIATTLRQFPWLVCDRQGEVLGYVYTSPHRARAAYQWSVDVSVYIHAKARRTGMGRALYHALFALLSLQGFYQGFAGITLPNPASVGLHEALGFQPVGVYQAVGYKLGSWHDEPVGPHPQAMYQVLFASEEFANVVPWLMLNREGLTVLVHPSTGDSYGDHLQRSLWLGRVLKLREEVLRRG